MRVKNRIGILGGLGPETTAKVYLDMIEKMTGETRPDVVIISIPLNLKKEAEYIKKGKNRKYFQKRLLEGVRTLERAGVSKIFIACNTVHEFFDVLQKSTKVPIFHLIKEVAKEVNKKKWNRPLLLATSEIVKTELYQTELNKLGIRLIIPTRIDQKMVDEVILSILSLNANKQSEMKLLKRVIKNNKTNEIILGCSDLFEFFNKDERVIDSMAVLVEACKNMV